MDITTSVIELNAALYDFTQDVQGAIFQAMGVVRARSTETFPAPPPILLLRGGYAESPGWYLVQAFEFDPEPLTLDKLRVRDIYASRSIVQALLDIMASEKWLDRREGGEYYLTEQGRTVMQRIRARQHLFLTNITSLAPESQESTAELERLLGRVVNACLDSTHPEMPWCLEHSRNRAPGTESLPLDRIRQYTEDLNAFRDDSHMAAWQPYCAEGYVWEAFSLVCDGQASTADELFEALHYRGYSKSEYKEALLELTQQSYLEEDKLEGQYRVSDKGREVRATVESRTDERFYAPWGILSEEEQRRLVELLTQLRDSLRSFATSA